MRVGDWGVFKDEYYEIPTWPSKKTLPSNMIFLNWNLNLKQVDKWIQHVRVLTPAACKFYFGSTKVIRVTCTCSSTVVPVNVVSRLEFIEPAWTRPWMTPLEPE